MNPTEKSTELKSRKLRRKPAKWQLFEAVNYRIFIAGIAVLIIGYIFMMQGPHDSFLSLHLSPVLLVIGYCILIPLAILYRSSKKEGD